MCVQQWSLLLSDAQSEFLVTRLNSRPSQQLAKIKIKNQRHTANIKLELDGCIVWNAHNTVLNSKRLAICATV